MTMTFDTVGAGMGFGAESDEIRAIGALLEPACVQDAIRTKTGYKSTFEQQQERIADLQIQLQNALNGNKDLAIQKESLEEAIDRKKAAHERWLERLVVGAHKNANEHGYCNVFDEFMISQGLPPRSWKYPVRVRRTITIEEYATVDVIVPYTDDGYESYISNFIDNDGSDIDWQEDGRDDGEAEIMDYGAYSREPYYSDGSSD